MKTVWIFILKTTAGEIERTETYGSIRQMCNDETIAIGNNIKSESAVRYLLKPENKYIDGRYHIEKKEIKRSERFI